MARTALAAQKADSDGVVVAFSAANVDGHSYVPKVGRALHVKNGSGSAITVTVPTPMVLDGSLAVADRTINVATGAEVAIGLRQGDPYEQTDGQVYIDFSAVTSVTVALVDGAGV
jgi:hypothetical protein